MKKSSYNPPYDLQESACNGVALTQDVWVTLVDGERNVKLFHCHVRQAVAQETLEVEITDNVGTETKSQVAAIDTNYYLSLNWEHGSSTDRWSLGTTNSLGSSGGIELKYMKIRIRKTTAAGANITYARVLYGKKA